MGVLYTKDTKNWAIYNKKIKLETSKKDAIGNSRYRHFNNAIERGKLCEHERLMQEKKKRMYAKVSPSHPFLISYPAANHACHTRNQFHSRASSVTLKTCLISLATMQESNWTGLGWVACLDTCKPEIEDALQSGPEP